MQQYIQQARTDDDGDSNGGDAAMVWRNRTDDVDGDEPEEGVMLVVLQPKTTN